MKNIKYCILALLLFMLTDVACAQEETVTRTNRDRANITEKFSVLKSDKKTKQGLYQAYYDGPSRKTVLAASGMYDHGKKVGVWHYYDWQGALAQHFDFTHNKLLYSRPDTGSKYRYNAQLSVTDSLTRPVKIGAFGYGYYDFVMSYYTIANKDIRDHGNGTYNISHVLSIDASGKLTAYHLEVTEGDFKREYDIKPETLFEDDLLFVPATVNHKPIASTITITSTTQTGFMMIGR